MKKEFPADKADFLFWLKKTFPVIARYESTMNNWKTDSGKNIHLANTTYFDNGIIMMFFVGNERDGFISAKISCNEIKEGGISVNFESSGKEKISIVSKYLYKNAKHKFVDNMV